MSVLAKLASLDRKAARHNLVSQSCQLSWLATSPLATDRYLSAPRVYISLSPLDALRIRSLPAPSHLCAVL
jgi:hypothetical protein